MTSLPILLAVRDISRPKTQGVLLDGTIFFCNTGQKDKATFMNKNITIELY